MVIVGNKMTIKIASTLAAMTLTASFASVSAGNKINSQIHENPLLGEHGLVSMPRCTDNKGNWVTFVGKPNSHFKQRHTGLAYAFRMSGRPMVHYDADTLPRTPPEFQNHVLAHECAHHLLGHFDRPSSPSPLEDDREEREADCYALEALGYGYKEAEIIAKTLDELYPFDPNKPINITVPDIRPNLNHCLSQRIS
jgi:hypothetical protein